MPQPDQLYVSGFSGTSYIELVQLITLDPRDPSLAMIREAAAALSQGGIVAFPTDTLYGLAADPHNERAIERLYAIKRRAHDQALPLIAADEAQVTAQVGELALVGRRLASRFWPGPLTLILAARPTLCPRVHASTGRVAVRVPSHVTARALARIAGHAITATSANVSGEVSASTAREVMNALGDRIDVLLDAGPTPGGPPSTIVDVTGPTPVLIRAGVVPWERVLEFLQCPPPRSAS